MFTIIVNKASTIRTIEVHTFILNFNCRFYCCKIRRICIKRHIFLNDDCCIFWSTCMRLYLRILHQQIVVCLQWIFRKLPYWRWIYNGPYHKQSHLQYHTSIDVSILFDSHKSTALFVSSTTAIYTFKYAAPRRKSKEGAHYVWYLHRWYEKLPNYKEIGDFCCMGLLNLWDTYYPYHTEKLKEEKKSLQHLPWWFN